MQNLIEEVMTWNTYPNQNPPWSGWEYVPKNPKDIKRLADILGCDMTFETEKACLQIDKDSFICCVDGNVWNLNEKEFENVLSKLKND